MTSPLRSTRNRLKVVVIGAGLAGLSASCHLAGRGHDVVVLERGDRPGGRAVRIHREGFTFDTGPTVLTMPALVSATIRAAGADPADLIEYRPLDPAYRSHFADGSVIQVRANPEATRDEILDQCGSREADGFLRFCTWAEELYRLEMPHYIDRNFDRVWHLAAPAPGIRLLRMGALRSMHAKIATFFQDERLRRLFTFQALYAGMSPHQARAAYAVISYMDTVAGVFTPVGGIGAVPAALAAAAQKAGATIRYEDAAARIVLAAKTGGRVVAVETARGERLAADAVVVTADRPVAYQQLLPGLPDGDRRRRGYSPSALVWHVGQRGGPQIAGTAPAHHNIHFGSAWRGSFHALLRDRRPMPDPSVLVTVPTVSHPELAPPGDSTLYVLEPVPNLAEPGTVDWASMRERLRDRLAERLVHWGYLRGSIVTDHLVDPTDWAAQGMAAGTPFAVAHTFFQSGPFRPPNIDRRVPGLVFAGSGTVPGVGVPMVLLSGRLAAERVEELT